MKEGAARRKRERAGNTLEKWFHRLWHLWIRLPHMPRGGVRWTDSAIGSTWLDRDCVCKRTLLSLQCLTLPQNLYGGTGKGGKVGRISRGILQCTDCNPGLYWLNQHTVDLPKLKYLYYGNLPGENTILNLHISQNIMTVHFLYRTPQ